MATSTLKVSRGRWWGSGTRELDLMPGSEVDREAYRMLIAARLDPRDGQTRLGRCLGKAAVRPETLPLGHVIVG